MDQQLFFIALTNGASGRVHNFEDLPLPMIGWSMMW